MGKYPSMDYYVTSKIDFSVVQVKHLEALSRLVTSSQLCTLMLNGSRKALKSALW